MTILRPVRSWHRPALRAVAMCFGAELRTRWRSWLALGLVVGVAAGTVMALASGARRTDSAYSRFLDAQHAYDVAIINYPEDGTAVFDFDELVRLPQVSDAARAMYEYYTFDAGNILSLDGRIGTDINRFKILEGRAPAPDRPDEMAVGFVLAEEHGIEVGDRVELFPREYIEYLQSPEPVEHPFPEETEGLTATELRAQHQAGRRLLDALPDGTVRVVGIEASPGEFPPQFAVNRPLVHLSPALGPLLDDLEGESRHEVLVVRLRGGADAVDGFLAELERRSGGEELQVIAQRDHASAVQRSLHFQAVALWLLASMTAAVSVLIIGQLVSRLTFLESFEQPVLRALGMRTGALMGLGVLRVTTIGVIGATVGAVGAVMASRLFPTGLARVAEPNDGFDVDAPVLIIGIGLTVVATTALALWPAWRVSRLGSTAGRDARTHVSWLTSVVAPRVPPAAAVGVRMALEPGRGRGAVPVRTTLVGVIVGIGALVGALTFGASLSHVLDTPELYGVTWDFELTTFDPDQVDAFGPEAVEFLRTDDRVEALARGTASFGRLIEVADERVDLIVLDSVKANLGLPVLQGRAPSGPDEIVLGARTLRSLDKGIGDVVEVGTPAGGVAVRRRIVGTAVFPTVSEFAHLGEGALMTPEGAAALAGSDDPVDFGVVVRLAPGVDPDAVVSDFNDEFAVDALPYGGGTPSDIVNFGRVETMPFVLGGVMAAISAAMLTHVLISATRRRRRDLAVLKALGFVRRQVAAAVAAQATTVVVLGLLVGVPLGVALGRMAWTRMADSLGVVSSPRVPAGAVGAVVMVVLLLGNAIAVLPARFAARTPPATILREE